jgi:V8-like Glu-specific endopeptidase|tara:strand:- start:53 stop:1636 length:1584 start_codon:yes stop_codon:yes gene_type:complete
MFSTIIVSAVCSAAPLQERLPLEAIPVKILKSIDYGTVFDQDTSREKVGLPLLFAEPTEASITPATHGIWERLPQNKMRWTYRVLCDNALSMNLGFGKFSMPESGSMTITNKTNTFQIRPFTSEDNKDHGELWTPIVPSNQAVIEIVVDRKDKRFVSRNIELTSINAGYRGFKSDEDRGDSGSCNIDVVCSQGDDWWNEIPSVGVYTLSGYLTCTGAMINNTAEDQTPYFLTANHCGVTSSTDSSIVVYWNHQNTYCRTPGSGDSGGNGNGNFSQFTSGSTMRATRSYTDFTLTELSSQPNTNWGVTWSGWSRASSTGGVGAGIHHPSTAEKRISFPDYSTASGEYWNVNWSEGTTEPGSSGSPLYDSNHRIVGQLCCGAAACGNDSNDYYGRSIGLSWSGSSSASLSNWLDPIGTNPTYLDTYNPSAAPEGACCIEAAQACLDVREDICLSGGGVYQGDNTACATTDCFPEPDCPSDVNGDGMTDVSDILAVVGAWGTADADADVNDDGVVSVADLLVLIDAWGPC